jgi:hypothetical protein
MTPVQPELIQNPFRNSVTATDLGYSKTYSQQRRDQLSQPRVELYQKRDESPIEADAVTYEPISNNLSPISNSKGQNTFDEGKSIVSGIKILP